MKAVLRLTWMVEKGDMAMRAVSEVTQKAAPRIDLYQVRKLFAVETLRQSPGMSPTLRQTRLGLLATNLA